MTDHTRARLAIADNKLRHAKQALEAVQRSIGDLALAKQTFDQGRSRRNFCRLRRIADGEFDAAAAASASAADFRDSSRKDIAINELWQWQEAGRARDERFFGTALGTPLARASLAASRPGSGGALSNRELILGSLSYLCSFGLLAQVADLMDRTGAGPNDRLWPSSTPLLHLAAQRGHLDVVRFLLGRGASPEATDREGATAFYRACCAGKLAIARVLAEEYGANVKADLGGDGAFYVAVSKGHRDVVAFLMGPTLDVNFHMVKDRCLAKAVAKGWTRILWLLKARVKQDGDKATAIQAVFRGHAARLYAKARRARFIEAEAWSIGQLRKAVARCSGGGDVLTQHVFALEGALDEAQGLFRWWKYPTDIGNASRLVYMFGIK